MAEAKGADDDGLERRKKAFTEARDLTATARTESDKDTDYYDGHQLTPEQITALRKRKQPEIVINRIRPAVNGILGVVERGKSEPRAFPRTPKDEGSADVATDTLRYIADFNRFDQTKIRCFKDMLVPGSMAAQVLVDADLQVTVEQVRFEEFFYDPRSRREDFGDARYLGVAKWMFADDVKALYPERVDDIEAGVEAGSGFAAASVQFQDRPSDGPISWCDRKRRRLLVIELYEREGQKWVRSCFIWTAYLAEPQDSPYLDDKGRPTCPIVACSAYVDRENNRYGAVRDMRSPQDEINKRRSKALHFLNVRQIQENQPGAGMGSADEARIEAAKPDGALPSGWQVVPQTDQVRGQLELLQEAKGEIERLGPNPAILGREGTDASGRALLARQQSGLVELAILFGHLDDWELRIYRQCWARARQFWTEPQFIRVTDDEGAPEFVGLNQPRGRPVTDMNGQPVVDPQTGEPQETQPVIDPATGASVFGYKNVLAEMDIDIILDSTPDTANVQQEQFQDLMQLVGSNPAYAQTVPFEMMLELSTVPHKRDLIDKLKQYREGQMQQQAAIQQQQMQIGEAKAAADIRKTNAGAALDEAKAQNEQLKPQMDALQLGIQAGQRPPPGPTGVAQAGA
ncbi:MAG TPA: hypothetical protein VJ775_05880 [Sphingomicrobium sp.]|nr:hypothetical protein [Sphingomicrobium sp.]